MRPTLRALAALFVLVLSAPSARAAEKSPTFPVAGLGYDFTNLASVSAVSPLPIVDPSASVANPLYLRLELLWAEIEKRQGEFVWTAADEVVDRFRAGKHEVILDLWGGNPLYSAEILTPPTVGEAKAVEAWSSFVREAARHFKGRVRYFEIGKTPNAAGIWGGADPARSYAFLLKKSAVIVRAETRGSVIVSGGIAGGDAAWLESLYAEGVAPYLDVVSFRPDSRRDLGEQCDALQGVIVQKDASARLWLEAVPVQGTGEDAGREMVRKLLVAFDRGAGLVTFALPFGVGGTSLGAEYLVRCHSTLGAGFGHVPSSDRITFLDGSGTPLVGVRAVAFYNTEKAIAVTGYWAETAGPGPVAIVRISARRPGPPVLYDPIAGHESQPKFEGESGGAKGDVPVGSSPAFLIYREGVGGETLPEGSESVEVSAARGITADEIIAHYREFQAAEDARLQHSRSDAMINFHFRLAGTSTTIDVGMGGSYFWEPKVGAEWELRDYYLNGNRSKWKEFPELPLVQPEKVVTLPLDITFDRSYGYVYDGEETVEGRKCYVLAFEPVDPARTLYRGRVWIDETNWARVRVASIQTKLEPPFLSNEEKTNYAPVAGPDGLEYWVISHIDGQQIFSTSGRNFIVLREIVFTNHRINDPEFGKVRSEAYTSNHQILRDTDKGFRYLEKTPTGERRVKENIDTSQFFGLGGILYDPSLKTPVPLLGANYFDYNFRKTGIQVNVFFAGVLTTINATNPNIGRTGLELGGDLFLSALARTDKDFENGREVKQRVVKTRTQAVFFNLGRELGDFVKLRATYSLAYEAYDTDTDTASNFILPRDSLVQTSSVTGTFDRSGYEVRAEASYSVRRRFAFWGRPGGQDFDPRARGFYMYEAGGSKEFFLPAFQKLRFAVEGYGGSDLDRFSRYSFNRFGARVRGFAGSGVRFDSGAIMRGAYLFNVAGLIRFEAAIDQARVRTRGFDARITNHTGLGLSGNVLGPWKTVWQLDYGYALRSDVKATRGDQEVLLVILKLF